MSKAKSVSKFMRGTKLFLFQKRKFSQGKTRRKTALTKQKLYFSVPMIKINDKIGSWPWIESMQWVLINALKKTAFTLNPVPDFFIFFRPLVCLIIFLDKWVYLWTTIYSFETTWIFFVGLKLSCEDWQHLELVCMYLRRSINEQLRSL